MTLPEDKISEHLFDLMFRCTTLSFDDVDRKVCSSILGTIEPHIWKTLASMTVFHGVQSLAAERFEMLHDCSGVLHPQVEQYPPQVLRKTQVYNVFLLRELSRVLTLFEKSGIKALAFKGPLLAHLAYGSLSRRSCDDLDILIPEENYAIVKRILESDGYFQRGSQSHLGPWRRRIDMFFNRQASFVKGASVYRLDVHTSLMPPLIYYPTSFRTFYGRSRKVGVGAVTMRTLSVEDSLLLLCFHGLKNRWNRLKYVSDIAFLLENEEIDWDVMLRYARSAHGERVLFLGLWLSKLLYSTSYPRPILDRLLSEADMRNLADQVVQNLPSRNRYTDMAYRERVTFNLALQKTWYTRMRYIFLSLLRKALSPVHSTM